MKQTAAISLSRSRPADRVIRVVRRRSRISAFLNSLAAFLRFGSTPGAK